MNWLATHPTVPPLTNFAISISNGISNDVVIIVARSGSCIGRYVLMNTSGS